MEIKKSLAAAALTLLVASPPAMAKNNKSHGKGKNKTQSEWSGEQRRKFDEQFARYDRNGDGAISRAEFPVEASLFDRFDLNRDGFVTRAEVEQAVPNRAAAEREARGFDRNRDGVITRDEFPGNDNAFSRLDRNRDGVLSDADRGGNGKQKRH